MRFYTTNNVPEKQILKTRVGKVHSYIRSWTVRGICGYSTYEIINLLLDKYDDGSFFTNKEFKEIKHKFAHGTPADEFLTETEKTDIIRELESLILSDLIDNLIDKEKNEAWENENTKEA